MLPSPPAYIQQDLPNYLGIGFADGVNAEAIEKARLRAQVDLYSKIETSVSSKIEEQRETKSGYGFFGKKFRDQDKLIQTSSTKTNFENVPGCSLVDVSIQGKVTCVKVKLEGTVVEQFYRTKLEQVQSQVEKGFEVFKGSGSRAVENQLSKDLTRWSELIAMAQLFGFKADVKTFENSELVFNDLTRINLMPAGLKLKQTPIALQAVESLSNPQARHTVLVSLKEVQRVQTFRDRFKMVYTFQVIQTGCVRQIQVEGENSTQVAQNLASKRYIFYF